MMIKNQIKNSKFIVIRIYDFIGWKRSKHKTPNLSYYLLSCDREY